jgi:pyoverdine/dityrosine biosynthesis protein Dit1/AcrR family transcriptional regulator
MSTQDALDAERLFAAALRLFRQRGYPAVTLAEIAAEAGLPAEELFRHFPRKEQFILRLYERLAADLEAGAAELAAGTVAERAAAVLRRKLDLLAPHVELFHPLVAAALDPGERLAILGRETDRIRERVQGVFAAAVLGASDAPPAEAVPRAVRMLYALHLACVGLLMQDQTPGRELTAEAVGLFADLVRLAGPLWRRERSGLLGRLAASSLGLPDPAALSGRLDRLVARFVQPPHDPAHFDLAENILRDLFRHRRLQTGAGACATDPCAQCLALHLPRVRSALSAGAPVRMVLPAFPAKSANRTKTLGPLPDLGEDLALRFLQERCDAVRGRYPPGARLTICSDGRVFNDLVGVGDDEVTEYRRRLIEMIGRLGLADIDVFDLDDVWPGEPFEATRKRLSEEYGEPMADLVQRTRTFPHHQQLYNGIHRFLTEDLIDREPGLSRNQARTRSKEPAYEVVRRSNAWGKLVAVYFPDALRLSIHPQPPHGEKIGIMLVPAEDVWLTPWHAAVLLQADRFTLMHRADAEKLGARLVEAGGRPSHFESPPGTEARS